MVGWNERLQHVTNLQRANEWIYSQPTVSVLITAGTERHRAGRGTWGGGWRGARPARGDRAWFRLCLRLSPGAAQSPSAPTAAASGSWFGSGEVGRGARFAADFTLANAAVPQGAAFRHLPARPDGTRAPCPRGGTIVLWASTCPARASSLRSHLWLLYAISKQRSRVASSHLGWLCRKGSRGNVR